MKYFSLFFTLFILIACKTSKDQSKKEPATVATQDTLQEQGATEPEAHSNAPLETLILGNWQWSKTICCGRTPHTETAESLPAPKILKFQPGGIMQYFSGDSKTSDQTYKIAYELLKDDGRATITIGARQPALLHIEGDNMIIDYGYIDLQTEYYVRVK